MLTLYDYFLISEWDKSDKVCCLLCGHCWGVGCTESGTYAVFVKILNFSVRESDTDANITDYNRWHDVPFKFDVWSSTEERKYRSEVKYYFLYILNSMCSI